MATTEEIETLFRKHYPGLLRLAFGILLDEDKARDAVHDVFASLMDKRLEEATAAYLTVAVRNKCLTTLRDMSARERIHNLYTLETAESEGDEWPDGETLMALREMMEKHLSPQCRKVVNLRFSQGKSYGETGEALGISKAAVYKHLRHAIDTLRTKLERHGKD